MVASGNQIRTSQLIWHLLENRIPGSVTIFLQKRVDIGLKESITRMEKPISFVTKLITEIIPVIQIHMTTKSSGWDRITIRNGEQLPITRMEMSRI